jgi:hypothetical protein
MMTRNMITLWIRFAVDECRACRGNRGFARGFGRRRNRLSRNARRCPVADSLWQVTSSRSTATSYRPPKILARYKDITVDYLR